MFFPWFLFISLCSSESIVDPEKLLKRYQDALIGKQDLEYVLDDLYKIKRCYTYKFGDRDPTEDRDQFIDFLISIQDCIVLTDDKYLAIRNFTHITGHRYGFNIDLFDDEKFLKASFYYEARTYEPFNKIEFQSRIYYENAVRCIEGEIVNPLIDEKKTGEKLAKKLMKSYTVAAYYVDSEKFLRITNKPYNIHVCEEYQNVPIPRAKYFETQVSVYRHIENFGKNINVTYFNAREGFLNFTVETGANNEHNVQFTANRINDKILLTSEKVSSCFRSDVLYEIETFIEKSIKELMEKYTKAINEKDKETFEKIRGIKYKEGYYNVGIKPFIPENIKINYTTGKIEFDCFKKGFMVVYVVGLKSDEYVIETETWSMII
ncbi:unnamed protein product [Caenorhabditis angaria]|uniref:Uncharacterized protein n=1 Tax=Caenorhabditis angaria TaxID=860376 RepID=A0A9P1N051_9PELO|nr:unnamed protein product [Caenorhabditis angaria]